MKKTLLIGLTFGLLLSGCNDEESLGTGKGTGVRFTSYMVESRATDTAWEAGDEIGVYMQNAASTSSYQKINVKYTNSAENVNTFTAESPIQYLDESTVNFMAVYPFSASVTSGNYTFTLGNESLSKNDIMYASASSVAAGTENVTLEFTHKLTKIVLQLNDENGNPITGATVSIDKQRVNGSMDMATGNVTATDDYTSTLGFAESNESGTYEAIVIPDEGCTGRNVLITTADNKKYSYPVGDIAFSEATKYTFPVSLRPAEPGEEGGDEGGETIIKLDAVTFSIDDWTEGKTIGWIISTEATISTENKVKTELATNLSLTTGSSQNITLKSDMTLTATDVYCLEYTRTDVKLTAATLIISQPNATSSRATQSTYTLPAGLQNGRLLFAVGDYTNGINVSSTVALTLDAVSVYSESGSSTEDPDTPPVVGDEIEIWTGSQNLGNWDNGTSIDYTNADILAQTTAGSTLRFYYSEKSDGAQVQFADITIEVTDNIGYVDMEVTADVVTALTGNNWPYLNGANITITKITLIPSGSDDSGETETPVQEEIEVWTGLHNLGNWDNGTSIDYTNADILAQTTVGSTLRFHYTDWTEGAQLQFVGLNTIDITENTGYVDIEVTTEILGKIAESNNWPYVNGKNMTITKVTLIPAEN